jgi:hypothetical protein
LKYNGGETPTHALMPDSPALDRAETQYGSLGDQQDQRGAPCANYLDFASHPGPTDGSDIGAFELGFPPLAIARTEEEATLSWPDWNGGGFVVEVSTNVVSNDWTTEGGATTQVKNQFIFKTPVEGTRFFRLKKTTE